MTKRVILVQDFGGAGEYHWLNHWQACNPELMQFAKFDPYSLVCQAWVQGIEEAVAQAGEGAPTLVAHGLGCIAVAHWARISRRLIHGAMLVSPPDRSSLAALTQTRGFIPVPKAVLPFRTLVVAAEADGDHRDALEYANQWDTSLVVVGRICDEAADEHQTWSEGLLMLGNLLGTKEGLE